MQYVQALIGWIKDRAKRLAELMCCIFQGQCGESFRHSSMSCNLLTKILSICQANKSFTPIGVTTHAASFLLGEVLTLFGLAFLPCFRCPASHFFPVLSSKRC